VSGWLVEQLPRCMAEDPFLPRLVGIFEELADSVRVRIDGLEQSLDVSVAPPELVRWMGGWLGLVVEPSLPVQRQRRLVQEAGRMLGWRGTRFALERLVGALTDAAVRVSDSGGVHRLGEAPEGGGSATVLVEVESTGGVDERQLLAFVTAELPVGARLELRVGPLGDTTAQSQVHPSAEPIIGPGQEEQ
jgi:phage tail-like protein